MSEDPRRNEPESAGESVGSAYRKAGPYLDASWQLTGSVAVWVAVGFFLDKYFDTKPWLLVGGSVVGLGLGFYLFFRALMNIGKEKAGK